MTIFNKVKEGVKIAMKCKDPEARDIFKTILGEFQRVNDGKEIDDIEAVKKLRSLRDSEEEIMKIKKIHDSSYLDIINSLIPMAAEDSEVIEFIKTLDFSKYKHYKASITDIKAHFGPRAEGGQINKLLDEFIKK